METPSNQAGPAERSLPPQAVELLSEGLDQLDQGFGLYDRDYRLVYNNTAFGRIMGYPEEIYRAGAPIEDLVRCNAERGLYGAGDADEHVRFNLEVIKSGTTSSFERVMPDGRRVLVEFKPLASGGFILSYSDITDTRRAEAAQEKSQQQLMDALESISEGFSWFDEEDRMILCNSRYKELYPSVSDVIAPGTKFSEITKSAAERGTIK